MSAEAPEGVGAREGAAAPASAGASGAIAPGTPAPVIDLPDTHGTPVRLGGPRECPQLVVFLPFAFSRVCTGELQALAAEPLPGVDVVAVTCDTPPALRAWGEQEGVSFPLLSDFWPHGAAARAFGVFGDTAGFATRGSFLLDEDGAVAWSVHSPAGVARSVADYRAAVEALTGVSGDVARAGPPVPADSSAT